MGAYDDPGDDEPPPFGGPGVAVLIAAIGLLLLIVGVVTVLGLLDLVQWLERTLNG